MRTSRIALFLAGFVIGGCVGNIPDPPSEGRTGEGTDVGSRDGGQAGGDSGGSSNGDASHGDSGAAGSTDDAGDVADDGGLVIGCHTADDCPGTEVCCGRKEDHDNSVYKSVSCEATCDGAYVYDHSTFCDPSDPHSCDGVVVNPHCEPSDILPGLYVCVSE